MSPATLTALLAGITLLVNIIAVGVALKVKIEVLERLDKLDERYVLRREYEVLHPLAPTPLPHHAHRG